MQAPEEFDRVGLCRTCRHAEVVSAARGSRFYRCLLAEEDHRYKKYPRLPVVECAGHARRAIPSSQGAGTG